MKDISRRNLLKGSAAAAAAGAASISFGELFHFSHVFAQGDGDDPQTILNLAATAETFACVHYYNALMNADALNLTADETRNLKTFLDAELKHKQFLEANGAKALATSFYAPPICGQTAARLSARATPPKAGSSVRTWRQFAVLPN